MTKVQIRYIESVIYTWLPFTDFFKSGNAGLEFTPEILGVEILESDWQVTNSAKEDDETVETDAKKLKFNIVFL